MKYIASHTKHKENPKRPLSIKIWVGFFLFSLGINALMLIFFNDFFWKFQREIYGGYTPPIVMLFIGTALGSITSYRLFFWKYDSPIWAAAGAVYGTLVSIYISEKSPAIQGVWPTLVGIIITGIFLYKFFQFRKSGLLFDGAPMRPVPSAASLAPQYQPSQAISQATNTPAMPQRTAAPFTSSSPTLPAADAAIEQQAWAQVSDEMEGGYTDKGLWARCFAESDGDETKTKARYMQARQQAIVLNTLKEIADTQAISAAQLEHERKKQIEDAEKAQAAKDAFYKDKAREIALIKESIRYGLEDKKIIATMLKESNGDMNIATEKYINYCLKNFQELDYRNLEKNLTGKNFNSSLVMTLVLIAFAVFGTLSMYGSRGGKEEAAVEAEAVAPVAVEAEPAASAPTTTAQPQAAAVDVVASAPVVSEQITTTDIPEKHTVAEPTSKPWYAQSIAERKANSRLLAENAIIGQSTLSPKGLPPTFTIDDFLSTGSFDSFPSIVPVSTNPVTYIDLDNYELDPETIKMLHFYVGRRPDFAGENVMALWIPSAYCYYGAIINTRTGKPTFFPDKICGWDESKKKTSMPVLFTINSRMLTLVGDLGNTGQYGFHMYVFQGDGNLQKLGFAPANRK